MMAAVPKDPSSPFFVRAVEQRCAAIVERYVQQVADLQSEVARFAEEVDARAADNASFKKADERWLRSLVGKLVDETLTSKEAQAAYQDWRIKYPERLRVCRSVIKENLDSRCSTLLEVLKLPPGERRAAGVYARERAAARDRLAGELRGDRAVRRRLRAELADLRKRLAAALEAERCARARTEAADARTSYPPVPPPVSGLRKAPRGEGMPVAAGVYFLWSPDADLVEYVGRAVNLQGRVREGHHILRDDHRISYLELDVRIIDWAEHYYIGLVRPPLNGGKTRERLERRGGRPADSTL